MFSLGLRAFGPKMKFQAQPRLGLGSGSGRTSGPGHPWTTLTACSKKLAAVSSENDGWSRKASLFSPTEKRFSLLWIFILVGVLLSCKKVLRFYFSVCVGWTLNDPSVENAFTYCDKSTRSITRSRPQLLNFVWTFSLRVIDGAALQPGSLDLRFYHSNSRNSSFPCELGG